MDTLPCFFLFIIGVFNQLSAFTGLFPVVLPLHRGSSPRRAQRDHGFACHGPGCIWMSFYGSLSPSRSFNQTRPSVTYIAKRRTLGAISGRHIAPVIVHWIGIIESCVSGSLSASLHGATSELTNRLSKTCALQDEWGSKAWLLDLKLLEEQQLSKRMLE